MYELTGLNTVDGKPIHSYSYIEQLREIENRAKESKNFIFQKAAQENGLHSSVDIMVFGGNRGGGKANTCSTPVATPSGFIKMGELEIGDYICTPYNGIQKVSGIYEQGENTVYILHFDDGSDLTCMDNHRFWARASASEKFHEMTAREIFDRYKIDAQFPMSLRKGNTELVEFPLCGEVELNEQRTQIDLPLHPYVLGYISGTGFWRFGRKGIKLSDKLWHTYLIPKYGYKVRLSKKDGFYYLKGIPDEVRLQITGTRAEQPAKIPPEYMTASIQSRWDYLRGVMYKNGHSQKKHPYLELPNKKLIEDIAQMARSLGIWARISRVEDGVDKIGYWRVSFKAPDDEKLFVKSSFKERAHKNAEVPTSPDCEDVLTKKILYITKSHHKQKCRCITVTGRDHLYMTDAYTVNHNTITMLMEPIYDIGNKHFNGIIFRKNKDDFENIINESKRWFSNLGRYNKSKDDMTWYFKSGAKLGLTIYDMPMAEFDVKYRGQQFAYIGIDELTQMSFEMFKFLMTCNRNTVGSRSRMLGTCNPDPLSWLRKFLDYWIGADGFIIPERDGAVRYCYMPDDSVDNILWGDTPEEVYEQCKDIIDDAWNPELEQYGYDKVSFSVKSVTFIKAGLYDNKALLKSDPAYIANLLNQPPEIRAREFDGNWNVVRTGNDLIQPEHMERCFQNAQMLGDGVRRAACDIAGEGGDNCMLILKIGDHIADFAVFRRAPMTTFRMIKAKLKEWGVLEQNFVYDVQGMGQIFTGEEAFPNAVKFNNQGAVDSEYRLLYDNIKSQCAYMFAQHTQQGLWSIEPSLLNRTVMKRKTKMSFRNLLMLERKAIRQDMSKQDRGWCLIHKEQMKHSSVVGSSPDAIETLTMFEIFNINDEYDAEIPEFISRHVRSVRTFDFN